MHHPRSARGAAGNEARAQTRRRPAFAEHDLAPDASVERWQHRLNPLWRRITGGCNLDRKMDALIDAASFRVVELENECAKGPRPVSYIYAGRAAVAVS